MMLYIRGKGSTKCGNANWDVGTHKLVRFYGWIFNRRLWKVSRSDFSFRSHHCIMRHFSKPSRMWWQLGFANLTISIKFRQTLIVEHVISQLQPWIEINCSSISFYKLSIRRRSSSWVLLRIGQVKCAENEENGNCVSTWGEVNGQWLNELSLSINWKRLRSIRFLSR